MMQKKYSIEVDCANCAAAVERRVAKIRGVEEATISYMAQKMLVTYADGADEQAVLAEILAAARKIEPDFMIEA